MDENIVRKQDETTIVGDVATNPVGRKLAFDHLDQNWDYYFDRQNNFIF